MRLNNKVIFGKLKRFLRERESEKGRERDRDRERASITRDGCYETEAARIAFQVFAL